MRARKQSARLRLVSEEQGRASGEETAAGSGPARDRELLVRARHGETAAWARIYQDHFDPIYRYLLYLVGTPDQAEELTQETFARALVAARGFRFEASVATWLHRIALNTAREQWRRDKTRAAKAAQTRVVTLARQGSGSPEDAHGHAVRTRILYGVLEGLPPSLRQAFVLCDVMDLDRDEAAAHAGISPGNLAVRAHRARLRVRKALTDLGWIEGDGER